jgi:hypothetical protein
VAGNAIGAAKRLAFRAGLGVAEYLARAAAGEKYCWRCRAMHRVEMFGEDASRPDSRASACRDSKNARAQALYEPRPASSRLGTFLAESRDGDKRQARARVNHRVEIGRLPHPNTLPCTDCGHVHVSGERRHEYDHHLGYAAEHQLDVEAVCTTCHHEREAERRG